MTTRSAVYASVSLAEGSAAHSAIAEVLTDDPARAKLFIPTT